ncbi:hypothetical protein BGZ58_000449 [Dissophora ornata]|nr:hypothetical protein BGZ58_000449 [Dissophora ornata]
MATTNVARAPVRKPVPRPLQNVSQGQEAASARAFEISQVQSRYKSSFRSTNSSRKDSSDVYQLKIVPSDPDFPYEIESLHIELIVPNDYPETPCGVQVLNKDIPKGFTTNLERGFAETAHQKKSLLAHLNWLDVNMEQLLQKPPAPTIRFVGHGEQKTTGSTTAGSNAPTSNTSTPSLPPPLPKPSTKTTTPSSSSKEAPKANTQKLTAPAAVPLIKPVQKQFTAQEIEQAGVQRQKQMNQIQARFRATFSTVSATEVQIGLESVEKGPKMPVSWEGPLWINLLVPKEFPLEPCEIRLKQDGQNPEIELWRARNVEQGFRNIVAASPQLSLFQLLNQLNRDLKEFMNLPAQTAATAAPPKPMPAKAPPVVKPAAQAQSTQSSLTGSERQNARDRGLSSHDQHPERNRKLIYVDAPAPQPPRRNFELYEDHGVVTSEDDDDDEEEEEEEEEDSDDSGSDIDADSAEEDDQSENEDQEQGASEAGPLVDTAAPKRGIEIRMPDLKLDHISLLYCRSLNLLVRCNRCKGLFEIADLKPDDSSNQLQAGQSGSSSSTTSSPNDKRKWRTCENCQSLMGAHFRTEYIHMQSRTLGFLDLAGCTAFDILPSAFVPTCSECDQILGAYTGDGHGANTNVALSVDAEVTQGTEPPSTQGSGSVSNHAAPTGFRQRVGRGMSATANCRKCHVRLTFSMEGEVKFVKLSPGDMMKASKADLEQLPLKKKALNRKAKNGGLDFELKVGEPLPRKGACEHYKKSRRWFRFPCCSKIYACHLCHDEKEDHGCEFAKRMICGHCSREQTVSDKPCVCGESPVKIAGGSGAFWEGGEGMRDKTRMSNKDPRKFRGANKTVSKKQVGAENVRKRASKASKS